MFSDPLFTQLGAKHSRVVVSWNVATARDDELNRVIEYLAPRGGRRRHAAGDLRARARRRHDLQQAQEPQEGAVQAPDGEAVRGEPAACSRRTSRTCATSSRGTRSTTSRSRPTRTRRRPRSSRRSRARSSRAGPSSRPTSSTRPTTRAPSARRSARRRSYVKAFRKAYKGPRSVCGVHNYSDINRFRTHGHQGDHQGARLQADLAHRGGRPLQVRGLQGHPEPPAEGDEVHVPRRQGSNKKIKRLYVYTWFGGVHVALRRRPRRRTARRARPTPRCASTSSSRWRSLTRSGSSRPRAPT